MEILGIIVGVVSVVLAILAIVLSITFFFKARDAEQNAQVTLTEIRAQTKFLNDVTARMLNKFVTSVTRSSKSDELSNVLEAFLSERTQTSQQIQTLEQSVAQAHAGLDETDKWRVTNLITADFYCVLANLASLNYLPQDRSLLLHGDRIPALIDQTYNDHQILKRWLSAELPEKIASNTLSGWYEQIKEWDVEVKDVNKFYADLGGTSEAA